MFRLHHKLVLIVCNLLFCINLSGLQIDPLRTMIQVEAGRKETGSITLTNTEDRKVNISVSLKNQVLHESSKDRDWLTLEQNLVTIEPLQQAVLKYEVFVPNDVAGELKSRIAFSEVSSEQEAGMISINTKISVPFFATVKGTEVYDFEVIRFELKDDAKDGANVVIHNRGNVHVRPSGVCSIREIDGDRVLQSVQLNRTRYPVFPDEEKEFKVKFDEPLSPGKYIVEIQLESMTQVSRSIRQVFEFEVI